MIEKIKKRNGEVVNFKKEKISKAIYKAMEAVGEPNYDAAKELSEKVIKILEEEMEKEVPTVEGVQDIVEQTLVDSDRAKVAKEYILYREKRTEIRKQKKQILNKEEIDEVDKKFDINALRVLRSRYLRKNKEGDVIESPKELFKRVATHVTLPSIVFDKKIRNKKEGEKHEKEKFDPENFENEIKIGEFSLNRFHLRALKRVYDRYNKKGEIKHSWSDFLKMIKNGEFDKYEKEIKEYYDLMTKRKFLPNTPTLANFGNFLGMGSACFVLDIEDSIESIMDTLKRASIIFKSGGGVGYNFSKLRPEGDFVKSTGGIASGPVSFMRLFDRMTEVIKQGGCVSNQTMIRSDKGVIKIGDILNSRMLGNNRTKHFVYDGNEHNHAMLAMNNGSMEVYRVKTELGNHIDATWNHRVCTVDKNGDFVWKGVSDLETGDWVVNVLGGLVGDEIELEKPEYSHFNTKKIKMPDHLTPELAEIIGFYMADGCFSNGRMIFSISDEDLEKRVKKFMKKLFGLKLGEDRDKGTFKDLVFFSKALERYFKRKNWEKQSSPLAFIPKDIFLSKEDVACGFLRGLFEGDGTIHNDGYPILTSTSNRLIRETQQLLLALGIVSKIRKTKNKEGKNHWGDKEIYCLTVLTDRSIKKFKEKIGFISKLKKDRFRKYTREKKIEYSDLIPNISEVFKKYWEELPKSKRNQGRRRTRYARALGHYLREERTLTRKTLKKLMKRFKFLGEDEKLRKIIDDKYFFSRIRDIKKLTTSLPTMEIEVPASGSYVANGVLVHNIRRGANMGIMDINHPDIEKFITAKSGNKALNNFNISVFVKSDFWDYYEKDEPYPLVNPHTGEVTKHVDPKNLFDLIVYQAWESAEPGVVFEEHANRHNPMLDEFGPIKCTNPCVTEDTWVTTSEGPRKVKELIGKETEVVVDGKKWHNKDNGFFKTGVKPVFKLETEEGFEVKLTGNHPVKAVTKLTRRTLESEWKKVKDLRPEEKIVLNNHENLEWDGIYGEREGYLMGYMVGDGNGEKKVREVIENYAETLPHRKDFGGWTFTGEKYRLKIAHLTKIAKRLKLNKNKKITPEIEKTSSDFYKGFLKGIFDADSSVQGNHKKGISIRLAQSDLERLKSIQRMLLRLGIFSKIYKNRRESGKRKLPDGNGGYKLYDIKAQHELIISKENIFKFYKRIGFENTEKLNKLKKLLENYKRSPNRERFVATFKKLKPVGKKEVYDIQVPGINAFDANGFYVHNCGEVLLYPYESCNLGSINVWSFANKKPTNGREKNVDFDWEELKEVIKTATKLLDNVVEVNNYPLEKIEERTLNMRKIGLGMMGLGDLLYELEIPYDSEEGLEFMEKLMEFINYHSKIESIKLSKERGSFPLYEKSFYPDELPIDYEEGKMDWEKIKEKTKKHGIRNAFTTVIAPTGSISMIGGCSSGIEPVFSLVFEKKVSVGSFYYVDPVFEKAMMRKGLFDDDLIKEVSKREGRIQNLSFIPEELKKIFVTSMDIKAKDHINALASLQKWTDSSISKTINFPADTTIKEMKEAYLYAYKKGCKDLTVFRNKSMKGVLEAGKTKESKKNKREKKKEEKKLISLEDKKANGLSIYHEAGYHQNAGDKKDKCPNCESKVVNIEGCKKCLNCGWSACSS